MFKRNNNNNRFAGPMNQIYPEQPGFHPDMMQGALGMQPGSAIFPQVQEDRLQFEIRENRRRINNLTRRVIRLENYLRIRDTSDYVDLDDDHFPNDFSM